MLGSRLEGSRGCGAVAMVGLRLESWWMMMAWWVGYVASGVLCWDMLGCVMMDWM